MSLEEDIHNLLAPIVATLGVELTEVEFVGGTLKVVADEDGGITSDRLAEANRLISPVLDQHDPIPGRYTLEVTSPGLERPLKRLGHYERAVGEQVVVKTVPSVEPRRLRGVLVSVGAATDNGASIALEVDEIDGVELDEPERRELRLADVASARTVFIWGPAPKPGQKSGRKGKRAKPAGKVNRGVNPRGER